MEPTSATQSSSTASSTTTIPPEHTPNESKLSVVSEIIQFSLIALVIVLPIRIFVAQPFIVSGSSMENTFFTGQYLIVDQLTYHFNAPRRGDVIVFRYPKDPSKFFIKRVIGMPGDTVNIEGSTVTITNKEYPDGTVLNEEYILGMKPGTTLKETLGDEEYFVMGDNRDKSSDSRAWGVLRRDNIVGRAFLRLYPVSVVSVLPGNYDIDAHMQLQK